MSYTRSNTVTSAGEYRRIRKKKNMADEVTVQDRSLTETSEATYGENPNWRRQIRLQQNATTTLVGTVFQNRVIESYASWFCEKLVKKPSDPTGTVYDVYYSGLIGSYHMGTLDAPSSVSVTTADNLAKRYFLRKLIQSQRNFQSGVFLGELRETLAMLRRPAKAMRESIDSYHRTAKKRARRERTQKRKNRAVRDTWLEYSFGWVPMMSDVKSGAEALARYGQRLRWPGEYLIGRGDADNLDEVIVQSNVTSAGCYYKHYKKSWSAARVKYNGMTTSIPVNPITSAASIFGFMPRDFLPTIWELIPYSFLVDYFTNIGEMIEGYAWQRAGLRWSAKTIVRYRRMHVLCYPTTPQGGYAIRTAVPSSTYHESKSVARDTYNGTFVPSITFQVPGMGSLKWLNIAALARLRR